ncbi:MAG: peptidase M50, partial [Steroidobacteraceae bacterium]
MSLPNLRADLQLTPASPALDGSPRWTLADPVRGRYFKLGVAAMRLLRHWSLGDPEQVLRAASREPGLPLDGAELEQLLGFLRSHDLITALDPQQRASYSLKAAAQRQSLWQILLHQYLFFRIPLWRPDAFLNRAWPWLERFGPRALRYGLPVTLGLGVFLVSRDWQRFIATFPHLFS